MQMLGLQDPIAVFLLKFSPLARLTIVIFGAMLIHLSLGTYHTFGNMLPYMASYMHNNTDSTINHEMLVWIPTFQVTYGIMFGFGQGIAYVLTISCVINWAPKHVGFVSGVVAAGFGISSSIFAPLQTIYLNPLNHKPTEFGYFTDRDVIARVPSIFYTFAIVYAIMQAIGLIVICDPVDVKSLNEEIVNLSMEQKSLSPLQMLHSSTFYWLFGALFCCSFYGNMFYNLYKAFGETFIDDDMFIAYAFSIASICNALARIGWGILADRTTFQISLSIATFLATLLLLTMPLTSFGGKWMYLIWMNLMFVCVAATHALFITACVKCFGSRYKSANYGCLILSTAFSAVFLAVGCEYVLTIVGYKFSFLITALLAFIGTV
ncbi:unnamed protein product [Litomosoides sigmodontis]|uniref:Major facilitator superfamily (MFS) profile domain-containing protein n=1 Tax=Litomosoides sigmodontis TaxID=42156 RepID=A0A3P6V552_LITSI|nr:unnamed protein product [Litomosoides sigmodontis]